ncbi:MAG TPA: multiheme c-type cytochrome, partial [Gemmatimonadales bacterium]
MLTSLSRKLAGLLPFLLVAALAACTDEKIVEVERPPFNEPADPSSGFLGYYDADTKQTTCGNCHADFQATWSETVHADAYATLKANTGAQPFCYSCHTISANGNVATGTVGHDKVQDATYYDVQCESCHGPGLEHVEGVNAGTVVKPKALLGVGMRTKYDNGIYTHEMTADTANSCASCHTGTHHPYVEQWAESRHAYARVGYANRAGCGNRCHEARGTLESWGVKATWKEGAFSTTFD